MEAGMERPIFKPVGTPVAQLDTPALVVDLALVEHNIATLHAFFQQREAKVRPYVTAHRCPALAHKQLAAGSTVGGISVTTVGEAEVFADHGFDNICVANEVVTPQKIRRLCALARRASVIVAVDNPANVHDLSVAAAAHDVTLQVVVDIHTRLHRCGVEPGQPAVALAHVVHAAPHLEFAGLMSYEGPILTTDPEALAAESRQCIQQVLDTRELLERAGLPVRIVSVGNTSNYEIAGTMAGVTEVPAGAYVLLDAHYGPHRPQFTPAARVMTTVTSRPEPGTAIADAGQKAVSVDLGLPVAAALPGATVTSLSAEHCRLRLEGATDATLRLGDTFWLTPYDIGTCANLYDYIHAVRDGRLEAVWRVAARGQYR
jgi:D-serine deaminase-like pyridoxal phosphate-dependent protein